MTKRVAVIGAGNLARVRTKALLDTGGVSICGIASRTLSSARRFGGEVGCDQCFDDYDSLLSTRPDAVLVEVPHVPQDDAVLWALSNGLHVLIGGCLASSSRAGAQIKDMALSKGLVVEAGYSSRYSALWHHVKAIVVGGQLGEIAAVRSIALWDADPMSWYYEQEVSGGMPLTHMTYCFTNALRWILGNPLCVSAFANRLRHAGAGKVNEETCVATLLFKNDTLGTMTASYIKPGDVPGWSLLFLGTVGALEVLPASSTLVIHKEDGQQVIDHSTDADSFLLQAKAFVGTLNGGNECLNPPADAIGDVLVAEAIVASCESQNTVWL